MTTATAGLEGRLHGEPAGRSALPIGRAEHGAMFLLGFLPALAIGAWLLFVGHLLPPDAVTRVAHAHHVVLSRDPHVAAMGFIWPPLPSAVEVPLVLVLQPFGQAVFAAPIFSALFTGGLAVALNLFFAEMRLPRRLRLAAIAALFVNPLMAYYAANGMTEVAFLFFVVLVAWSFARWREARLAPLVVAGLATAGALAVRYEAAAVAAAGVAAIIVMDWAAHPRRLEATLTTYIVPFAFALMLWSLWSHLFIGDALNFLHGVGSNESFTEAFRTATPSAGPLEAAYHSITRTLGFSLQRVISVFPPFLPVLAVSAYFAVRGRDARLVAVILLAVAVPAFQVIQVYRGQLFPWVRFWITLVPFTFLLAAMWRDHLRERFHPVFAAVLVLAVVSSVSTLAVMAGDVSARDEALVAEPIVGNEWSRYLHPMDTTIDAFRDTAAYLDGLEAQAGRPILVLVDGFADAELVLYVHRPKMLAITPDRDFQSLLTDPVGRLDYMLIPAPTGVAAVSDINATYPGAWEAGTPFLEFVAEFPRIASARLYRVVRSAAAAGSGG